ncbi:hypothetical protein PRIC1_007300 [Phytophthora ramorum]|uniref:Uracil phosphoribosyltransferase n=1 Tax=Phytophthora ramorum TaxID=164328 RepID=UPI00309E8DD9|nr:Uracil phosphoribosyltransferase [Phytophthora ramorum]KAH7502139.1 Uracil phosphoribosyltransferase [Phytophthora ramorum]
MEPSRTALPQLSSYLPALSSDTPAVSMTTTGPSSTMAMKKRRNSIEGAFSAVSSCPPTPQQPKHDQRKRKQTPVELSTNTKGSKVVSFSRLDSIYQSQGQAASPVITPEGSSFSSTASSQDGDRSGIETTSYFASQSQTATPRRERTSRYLSEADRREVITRIDGGEKQVALAREFNVSRAAICNLYKNRWEVLTRGSRNSESKHPKKARNKKANPRLVPRPSTNAEASIAVSEVIYPDVSTISIHAEGTPRDDNVDSAMRESTLELNEDGPYQDTTLPSAEASDHGNSSQDHQAENLQHHHYQFQQKEEGEQRPGRQSHFKERVSSPVTSRAFLVHEASAYSYPCRNLVAALRDESISTVVFQQRATRLVRLLIEEALTCLPHEDIQVKNQFGDVCHAAKSLDERDICGVSMEDKGMVLLRAFSTISPTSPTGVITIETRATGDDTKDLTTPPILHAQLPCVSSHQAVLLLDIKCATGNEACAVLHHLVHERNIAPKSIYFVTVISSFEGLQNVFRHFPDVTLIAAQVDTVLDLNERIRPGIGNFMQRYWNVHSDSGAP